MGVYIKKEVINLSNSDNHARVPIYTNVGDFSVFSTIEKKAMLKKMTKERD